ncbi:hypothetical protein D3C75_1188810 [compost metagenome]
MVNTILNSTPPAVITTLFWKLRRIGVPLIRVSYDSRVKSTGKIPTLPLAMAP